MTVCPLLAGVYSSRGGGPGKALRGIAREGGGEQESAGGTRSGVLARRGGGSQRESHNHKRGGEELLRTPGARDPWVVAHTLKIETKNMGRQFSRIGRDHLFDRSF